MTTRGLRAGSLGILEVQRGNQGFVVGWDRLPVFPEALDIAGDGVLGHFSGFGQSAAVSDAAGQRGDEGRESTLGFRSKDHVKVVVRFLHRPSLH